MPGLIPLLVDDTAWAAVQTTDASTVQELLSALNAARDSGSVSFLTLCSGDQVGGRERILSPDGVPMGLIAPIGPPQIRASPFIRVVALSIASTDKQRLASEFCCFAEIKANRKDLWTTRWISLKERSLTWSKSARDTRIRGQLDLSDAYFEAGGWNKFYDGVCNTKTIGSFVLKIIKPERLVEVRFGNILLLSAWMHMLKERCPSGTENLHFDLVDEDIRQHEFKAWSRREEQFHRLSTLSSVLEYPLAFNVFLSYLKQTHSEEGLLFWLAVKRFKSSQIYGKNAAEFAQSIYTAFIAEGSRCELPLRCKERALLSSAVNGTPLRRNLFDNLIDSVLRQLEQEKFADFKKSSSFRSMLIRLSLPSRSNDMDSTIPVWEDLPFEDG